MSRYARQIQLPDVGLDGQDKFSRAKVAVIGAGGLGSPVLLYLAGAGVGHLTVLDADHVSQSNLHRQPLYRMSDIDRPKVAVAAEAIAALNPEVTVDARQCSLTPDVATQIVADADVVIDAADSFAVTYCLSDACYAAQTPLISASVLGQAGYVGGYCACAPSLRAVFPDLPQTGATCASAGVLGPVVGVVGSLQAQMALRVLLGCDPSPLGRMVTVDLESFVFGGFDFHGSPEPNDGFSFISKGMLREGDLVFELRDADEAPEPLVASARYMSQDDLAHFDPIPDRRIVLCCQSGLRAWQAASVLRARGARSLAVMAATLCADAP
ncbi:ThiF family adenylyltransferase [uncultured Litoreibacter sp.]|uniref:ThiF family adenylyltransferase n=1 Tax=uncultured Litoreibacter sp. TaxID=1392394 RepID=UPI00260E9FC0|nr:ThiF family adenylyltransferase [uncultured Litoreibacter sp.]